MTVTQYSHHERNTMQEDNNKIPLSRSARVFFKTVTALALFPFITLAVFGRIQHIIHSEWFAQVDTPATLIMLVLFAFIGADACRRAGYRNLESVHGLVGVIIIWMLLFKIIPSVILAILLAVVISPILYMLILRIHPREITRKPREGESEITVLSFIMGKHKKLK